MLDITYLCLVFVSSKRKMCYNVDVLWCTLLLAWWKRQRHGHKYFHLKTFSLFVFCSLLTSCVTESGKSYDFKNNDMMTNASYCNIRPLPCIGHCKDHSLITWRSQHSCTNVLYHFEHCGCWITAEWGVMWCNTNSWCPSNCQQLMFFQNVC